MCRRFWRARASGSARGVIHSAADGQIRIGSLIPVVPAQIHVRHVVQVAQTAARCELCDLGGAHHRRIVGGVARVVLGEELVIRLRAAVHFVRDDVDVVCILHVGIAAVNGSLQRRAALLFRLEVILLVAIAEENAEFARDVAERLQGGIVRRILGSVCRLTLHILRNLSQNQQ